MPPQFALILSTALAALSPLVADPLAPSNTPAEIHRFRIVPTIGYTPDTGWRLGAMARWTGYDTNSEIYRWALRVDLTATTLDQFVPAVELDLARLPGLRRPWRLNLAARVRVHPNEPFTGFGNTDLGTGRIGALPDSFYSYGKSQVRLFSTAFFPVRGELARTGSQWTFAAGLSGEFDSFTESRSNLDSSLTGPLMVQRPFGVEGGAWTSARVGFLYDSRDVPLYARRGMALEAWWEESLGPMGGPIAECRRVTAIGKFYLPFLKYFVLADRFTVDWLSGAWPFFMAERTGGEKEQSGPGGVDTVRGMPLHRIKGPIKAILNSEVRFHPPWTDIRLFRALWQWELVFFSDYARVWQTGEAFSLTDLQASLGGSLRLLWGRDFVVTLEFAWWQGKFGGTYFTVGQSF